MGIEKTINLNVPKSLIYMDMSNIRIPQIIEKQIIEGKNKTEIARDLGVNRKTITRDTQTDRYLTLVNEFLDLYFEKIREFMNSEASSEALEGMKEYGRSLRATRTRETKHTEDITVRATIDITEKRRQSEELIKKMELSPDQFRVLEENVKSENLEK